MEILLPLFERLALFYLLAGLFFVLIYSKWFDVFASERLNLIRAQEGKPALEWEDIGFSTTKSASLRFIGLSRIFIPHSIVATYFLVNRLARIAARAGR
jgi:hypothetical protein